MRTWILGALVHWAQAEVLPIVDPKPFTEWIGVSSDGLSRKATVKVPFVNSTGQEDEVSLLRVDLVGDVQQRGFAQGELLAFEIIEFSTVALPRWYAYEAASLDVSKYPAWIQPILLNALEEHADTVINRGLQAVWEHELPFVPPRLLAELDAIAEGVCATLATKDMGCNVDEWKHNLYLMNTIPEFVKMTCTMFGAWGAASASGDLLQLRALDFGASPFSNFSVLQVHRPAAGAAPFPTTADVWGSDGSALPQGFASLGLPGLVGVITGVSEKGIGLSEKVWLVTGSDGAQAGHYDGESDVFVMRDVLELSPNRSAAEAYMTSDDRRTWAVWLGVGDYATQRLDIVGYREANLSAFTPETMPSVTSQPYMADLVYVDKHTQPSDSTELPGLLAAHYGSIDIAATTDIISQHGTGDMHIGVYDFGTTPKFWFSIGRINENGEFAIEEWKACHRPFLEYNMVDLWAGI